MAAAFGFRYQYLITVELLLDLYAKDSSDWSVEVDPVNQDSADIVVHLTTGGPPERVLQVKASLPKSSKTIGVTETRQILDGLQREHSDARRRELVTNRRLTAELAEELSNTESTLFKARGYFVPRKESLKQLVEKLLHSIGKLRAAGEGGPSDELHYLLLRQLVDRVHEVGARNHDQSLVHEDIRKILEGSNPLLSTALGVRDWGKCIQVPSGDFIEREESSHFLKTHLRASSLYEGDPKIAVLKGLRGIGKSAAACLHARSLLEHVAFVLWLDASSTKVLESQVPIVLEKLGARFTPTDAPAQDLVEVLAGLPVPWALVLDGASSLDEVDPWVPRSGYGQVLLTTPVETWPDSFASATMSMDAFDTIEARRFMAHRLGQPVTSWSPEQISACDVMSQKLARWPLALEMAVGWIARHGDTTTAMQEFAKRVDRLNLNNKDLLPHSYPQTVVQLFRDQWENLSQEARKLTFFLLLMGGNRVPSRFLLDVLSPMGISNPALEELLTSAFIRQEILASSNPHGLDEVLTIHDFVRLVMEKQEILPDWGFDTSFPLKTEKLLSLLETSDAWIQSLTANGHFREGAVLIHPIDCLLGQMFAILKEPAMLRILCINMHNFAQLALLTSQTAIAHKWSKAAFDIRQRWPDPNQDSVELAKMQLQTLSIVAETAAYLHKREEVSVIANQVDCLLQQVGEYALGDKYTERSLHTLRDVLHSHLSTSSPPPARDVVRQLDILLGPGTPKPVIDSIGAALINSLQLKRAEALRLVERSAWQKGVDTALDAANHALEQEALVNYSVDGLLDIGLELMIEAAKRPLETPELLITSVKRLVVWLDNNSDRLNPDQQSCYVFLNAFVEDNLQALPDAIQALPRPEDRTTRQDAWARLAKFLQEQRLSKHRRKLVDDLPPSTCIMYGIDGGDQLNVWWRSIESSAPELWVHAAGIVSVSSKGKTDPVRENMAKAGLQEITQKEAPGPAHGWSMVTNGSGLQITDAEGIPQVSIEHIPEEINNRISKHGGLLLIYGDLAITQPTDRLLAGWIPLTYNNNQPHQDRQDRSMPWWRRLFAWLS